MAEPKSLFFEFKFEIRRGGSRAGDEPKSLMTFRGGTYGSPGRGSRRSGPDIGGSNWSWRSEKNRGDSRGRGQQLSHLNFGSSRYRSSVKKFRKWPKKKFSPIDAIFFLRIGLVETSVAAVDRFSIGSAVSEKKNKIHIWSGGGRRSKLEFRGRANGSG